MGSFLVTNIKLALAVLILTAVTVLGQGCAPVEFAPGPPENSLLDDGSEKVITESFTVADSTPKVDILIVDDNSRSMYSEQKKMGERVSDFLNQISDVDWRIAITTTDVSDAAFGLKGSLLYFEGMNSYVLTKSTPNYQNIFLKTVTREETDSCNPACPSGDEQPLRASILAMQKHNSDNRDFFRNEADLALFYLSDEDEMSVGPANATRAEDVLSEFSNIWSDTKRLLAFGIIIQENDDACSEAQAPDGHYASRVDSLVKATGGLTGSICAQSYGTILRNMGKELRKGLDSIQLSIEPNSSSVIVQMKPEQPNVKWSVAGRRIKFAKSPEDGTQISVSYVKKGHNRPPVGGNGDGDRKD